MATWRAKCWLGSANGYQDLEVHSNTYYGAKEQLQRIYGAEQVINLRQVSSSSSSSTNNSGCGLLLLAVVFGIGAVVAYWYYIIPIVVSIGLLYWLANR